jgi:hypothetical protein
MGIQVCFSLKEALQKTASSYNTDGSDVECYCYKYNGIPDHPQEHAREDSYEMGWKIHFPTGILSFTTGLGSDLAWFDANEWGRNRWMIQILKDNNISYTED